LLVGAYRENEVTAKHPLRLTLDATRTAGAVIHEIALEPLSLKDTEQLLGDALYCEPSRTRQFAALVHNKTRGNPFFTIQFLTTLAEERLLKFEAREAAWRWDLKRIRAKGFTDNVADLMIVKLRRLRQWLVLVASPGPVLPPGGRILTGPSRLPPFCSSRY
jgi:predicted ATPase